MNNFEKKYPNSKQINTRHEMIQLVPTFFVDSHEKRNSTYHKEAVYIRMAHSTRYLHLS